VVSGIRKALNGECIVDSEVHAIARTIHYSEGKDEGVSINKAVADVHQRHDNARHVDERLAPKAFAALRTAGALRGQYLYLCTSKASKLSTWRSPCPCGAQAC